MAKDLEAIIVLNDGQTYAVADQCKLMIVKADDLDAIAMGNLHMHNLKPVMEFNLSERFHA